MGTVTQYNLANVQAALGGANPISMSEYYRGGAYVPTTRASSTRSPASGDVYASGAYWFLDQYGSTYYSFFQYNGYNPPGFISGDVSSYTAGQTTYYRGNFRSYQPNIDGYGTNRTNYGVYSVTNSSVSINTGVPSSGQISMSQLYGAANP